LARHGLRTDGIDPSTAMIGLARDRHPEARLVHADICRWELPRSYDLIVAWDSTWHVPLGQLQPVLTKLCRGLAAGGVLVFTTGGTDVPSEKQDSCMGPPMYHATLGIPKTLQVLAASGCTCRHLEYDQRPEDHVYIIAQKAGTAGDP
jgi:predicted TPR repeat methyltransferase